MQVKRYYAGWNFARIDEFSLTIDLDPDTFVYDPITYSTGRYYHGALDDTSNGGFHESFALQLKTDLDAMALAKGSTAFWTVTWHNDLLAYEITSTGSFDYTANTTAQRILGLQSQFGSGVNLRSAWRPYYVIAPYVQGVSEWAGDRHLGGQKRGGHDDAGEPYGIGPTSFAKTSSWSQRFESRAAVYADQYATTGGGYAGTGRIPWTWEHFFEHCGSWEPFVLIDTDGQPLQYNTTHGIGRFYLREDADFDPQPTFGSVSYARYNIPISVYVSHRFDFH